jgi:hypothetical protein
MSAERQLFRVGNIDLNGIAGKLRLGPDKREAACLAHNAAAAVTADQPATFKTPIARVDRYPAGRLGEAFNVDAAPDLDAYCLRAIGKHDLEPLHFGRHVAVGRARQPVRPFRRVDLIVIEGDCSEVSGLAARLRLLPPLRRRLRLAPGRHKAVQQSAPIKRFDGRYRQAAHAERQFLQRRVRVLRALQHQHGNAGKAQLAGQEQADRASPGDDDVMDHASRKAILVDRSNGIFAACRCTKSI